MLENKWEKQIKSYCSLTFRWCCCFCCRRRHFHLFSAASFITCNKCKWIQNVYRVNSLLDFMKGSELNGLIIANYGVMSHTPVCLNSPNKNVILVWSNGENLFISFNKNKFNQNDQEMSLKLNGWESKKHKNNFAIRKAWGWWKKVNIKHIVIIHHHNWAFSVFVLYQIYWIVYICASKVLCFVLNLPISSDTLHIYPISFVFIHYHHHHRNDHISIRYAFGILMLCRIVFPLWFLLFVCTIEFWWRRHAKNEWIKLKRTARPCPL